MRRRRAQSVKRAYDDGGPQQHKVTGEPGSARWAVAEQSVFYRSTAHSDAPYIDTSTIEHTRPLQDGAVGNMAHTLTLRDTERMSERHGPQWQARPDCFSGVCPPGHSAESQGGHSPRRSAGSDCFE